MSKETKTFGDIEIENHKFHFYKDPIFINDVNVDNIFVSKNFFRAKEITNT